MKTSLNDIRNEYGETAYRIAKNQIDRLGSEYTNLDRAKRNAEKIIKLGEKDKAAAIAESLFYEIGYTDNWADLKNSVKKGGIKNNIDSVERLLSLGIKLPKDITDEYNKSKPGSKKVTKPREVKKKVDFRTIDVKGYCVKAHKRKIMIGAL